MTNQRLKKRRKQKIIDRQTDKVSYRANVSDSKKDRRIKEITRQLKL